MPAPLRPHVAASNALLLALLAAGAAGWAGGSATRPLHSPTEAARADCADDLHLDPSPYRTPGSGRAPSLRALGTFFLERTLGDYESGHARRAAALDTMAGSWSDFAQYCGAPRIYRFAGTGRMMLCAFGTGVAARGLGEWVLVRQSRPGAALAWRSLAGVTSPPSKFGAYSTDVRRVAPLPDFPGAVWVEMETNSSDISAAHSSDPTEHIERFRRWHGYVLRAEADSLRLLSNDVPVMESLRSLPVGAPPTSPMPLRRQTQIDVAFPRPGVMEVTARTDSLLAEQRCWLGTHVIDSTAAGLR